LHIARYWGLSFPDAGDYPHKTLPQWCDGLRQELGEACRRRLRADVPVGVYLSGGIDSGTICSLLNGAEDVRKRAYSVGFSEAAFDETARTRRLAEALGVQVKCCRTRNGNSARTCPGWFTTPKRRW
jgi:asparagine synthase (glutamine-hydrolysing)